MTDLNQAEARERILLDALKKIGSWEEPHVPSRKIAPDAYLWGFLQIKECADKALIDYGNLKLIQEQG